MRLRLRHPEQIPLTRRAHLCCLTGAQCREAGQYSWRFGGTSMDPLPVSGSSQQRMPSNRNRMPLQCCPAKSEQQTTRSRFHRVRAHALLLLYLKPARRARLRTWGSAASSPRFRTIRTRPRTTPSPEASTRPAASSHVRGCSRACCPRVPPRSAHWPAAPLSTHTAVAATAQRSGWHAACGGHPRPEPRVEAARRRACGALSAVLWPTPLAGEPKSAVGWLTGDEVCRSQGKEPTDSEGASQRVYLSNVSHVLMFPP